MKRTFSFWITAAGTALIAATYGLVRLAYGLLLPDMQAELGFDAAIAGAVSAGASLVYCAGALLGFALAPRASRALIAAAGLSAAIGAAGMALSPTVGPFAVFAVLSSAGAGLASPALVRIMQRRIRPQSVDRAQSIVNAGTGPGLVLAGLLALVLLPEWRAAWAAAALAAAVTAALVLLLDRRGGRADAGPPLRLLPPRRWWAAHSRVIAAALLMGAGSAAVWTYGRALLVDAGAPGHISMLAWVALGTGGTAVIASAAVMSRLPPRLAWSLTAGVAAVATASLVALPSSTPASLMACAAFGWAYTAATGTLITWTTRIDAMRASSGTALLFVLLMLGQAVGAAATGALVTGAGYAPAFLAAAGASVAATLLGLRRDRA